MIRVIKSQHSLQRLLLHFHLVVLSNLHRKQHAKCNIRLQEKKSNTESKERKDSPTDEAQIKHEQFHLVVSIIAILFSIAALFFISGVFFQDIVGHCIRIVLNDSWYNQQQHPQSGIDSPVATSLQKYVHSPGSLRITLQNQFLYL